MDRSPRLTPRILRDFGFLLGGILAGLGAYLWWSGASGVLAAAAAMTGVGLFLLGRFAPSSLERPCRMWLGAARMISAVTTPILFTIIFGVVMVPMSWVVRRMVRSPLKPTPGSTWTERTDMPRSDLRRQF